MLEFLQPFGLAGLFVLSFLGATVLPVASEPAFVAVLLAGADPVTCTISATVGNTLGAVTTWGIGRWGSVPVQDKILRMNAQERERADRFFAKYGVWSLFLSWAPIIGDPLCAVAGLFDLPLIRFLPPVLLGKLARYMALAYLTAGHSF